MFRRACLATAAETRKVQAEMRSSPNSTAPAEPPCSQYCTKNGEGSVAARYLSKDPAMDPCSAGCLISARHPLRERQATPPTLPFRPARKLAGIFECIYRRGRLPSAIDKGNRPSSAQCMSAALPNVFVEAAGDDQLVDFLEVR